MATVREIDPHDDQSLRAWFEEMQSGASAGRSFPLVSNFSEVAGTLRIPSNAARRSVFGAFEGEQLVGSLRLDFTLLENLDAVEWTLNVAPQNRGHGYGTALFEHGMKFAAEQGRTKHFAEIDVPFDMTVETNPGSRFALKHGFVSLHTEERMVLRLPVADEKLAELRAAAAPHHADYTFVSWTNECPDEYVDAYVNMRNEMERDVPTGELDHEPIVWTPQRLHESEQRLIARGFTSLITAARHRDGEFAGYSLIFVPLKTAEEAIQDDTLVMSNHRGYRLGTALKARNLAALQERFGERKRVHTWTDPDNAPMRNINHAFGFGAVELMHEFERDDKA